MLPSEIKAFKMNFFYINKYAERAIEHIENGEYDDAKNILIQIKRSSDYDEK
jgi:hypothetical protein